MSLTSIKWDEGHSDPKADIILTSDDETSFRVHRYYVLKTSGYISDMVEATNNKEEITIPLDFPTPLVRIYCNLVYPSHSADLKLEYAQHCQLLQLCQHMQSPEVETKVISSLSYLAEKIPWGVFVVAGERGDVELARAAIRAMGSEESGEHPGKDLPFMSVDTLQGTNHRFLSALLAARVQRAAINAEGAGNAALRAWCKTATRFKIASDP